MTDEQFNILDAKIDKLVEGQQNLLSIVFRAFTGNVKFETIVNQVRNLYDTQSANRPDSEIPVPGNGGVQETPAGNDGETATQGGADQAGAEPVADNTVGGADNGNGAKQ